MGVLEPCQERTLGVNPGGGPSPSKLPHPCYSLLAMSIWRSPKALQLNATPHWSLSPPHLPSLVPQFDWQQSHHPQSQA